MTVGHSALRFKDGERQQLSPCLEDQAIPKAIPLCTTVSPTVRADFEDHLSHGDTETPLSNSIATLVVSGSQKLAETTPDEGYTIDEFWESIQADF